MVILVFFSSFWFFLVLSYCFWFLLVLFGSFWLFYFFAVDIFSSFCFCMVLFYYFWFFLGPFCFFMVLFCSVMFFVSFYFFRVLFGVHTFSWPTFVNILPNKCDVIYHTRLAGSNLLQCIGSTRLTQIPNTLVHLVIWGLGLHLP